MNDVSPKSREPDRADSKAQPSMAEATAAAAAAAATATAEAMRRPNPTAHEATGSGAPAQARPESAAASAAAARPAPARKPGPSEPPTERLPPNVAAMLSYLFGWVSGLAFLLLDRRPFVRRHAARSVVVFATLSVLLLVFGDFFLAGLLPHLGTPLLVLRRLVELAWLVAACVLMLKASSGEHA